MVNDDSEEEDRGYSLTSIPILCTWIRDDPIARDNQILDVSVGIIGTMILRLSNLIKTLRNLICTLAWLGVVTIHSLYVLRPLSADSRYPDLYQVGNNFMSMLFFVNPRIK